VDPAAQPDPDEVLEEGAEREEAEVAVEVVAEAEVGDLGVNKDPFCLWRKTAAKKTN
jgi:hypothetical protein